MKCVRVRFAGGDADAGDLIGRLVAVATIKAGGRAVETGSGSGWVALAAWEVGRFERAGLP